MCGGSPSTLQATNADDPARAGTVNTIVGPIPVRRTAAGQAQAEAQTTERLTELEARRRGQLPFLPPPQAQPSTDRVAEAGEFDEEGRRRQRRRRGAAALRIPLNAQ